MWCYRRRTRTSWKEKKINQEVCQKLNTNQNIKRHDTILEETLQGRQEGRPTCQWMNTLVTQIIQHRGG